MRFRHVYMTIGSILVILLALLTDPDLHLIDSMKFGAATVVTLLVLSKTVLYVAALHLSRKALLDYLDLKSLFAKAMQTSEGAGRACMAVAIIFVAIAITIIAATGL